MIHTEFLVRTPQDQQQTHRQTDRGESTGKSDSNQIIQFAENKLNRKSFHFKYESEGLNVFPDKERGTWI